MLCVIKGLECAYNYKRDSIFIIKTTTSLILSNRMLEVDINHFFHKKEIKVRKEELTTEKKKNYVVKEYY